MCTYFPWHLYDFEHTDTVSAVIYSLSNSLPFMDSLFFYCNPGKNLAKA